MYKYIAALSEVSAIIEKEFIDAAIQQSVISEEDIISEEEVKAVENNEW